MANTFRSSAVRPVIRLISKGISAGDGQNTYRGLVKILKGAAGARNYSQCNSLLMGDKCAAHTFPYLEVTNNSSQVEHEASISKIGEHQLFYCKQRGISPEDAVLYQARSKSFTCVPAASVVSNCTPAGRRENTPLDVERTLRWTLSLDAGSRQR